VRSVYERDRRLLEFLDGLQVQPGKRIEVMGINYDDTVSLRVNGSPVQLGRAAARKIWVE
jgi:DtxR family Mn-dependent transcriptional regulator